MKPKPKKVDIEFYSEGENYPKNKILETVKTFGFFVDLDRWDEQDKCWMRIKNTRFPDAQSIIVYKYLLEDNKEKEYLEILFQNALISIGEQELKKKFNDLMRLDNN